MTFIKPASIILIAIGSLSGWLLLRTKAASQNTSAAPQLSTVLITLGENAKSLESWDGSVRVNAGEVAGVAGWHFLQADAVTGRDAWRCHTRRDAVAPYADLHYTEMRPGSVPSVLFHAVGVYVTLRSPAEVRVSVHTAQGDFDFALAEISEEVKPLLGGRATVVRVPTVQKLSETGYEDDDPAIVALPDGGFAVAWVAYKNRADRVLLREYRGGAWSSPVEVTPAPGDIFRCSLAAGANGDLWAFWSQRDGDVWHLWGRRRTTSGWGSPERVGGEGSDSFHRAAAAADGTVFVTWQSFRRGQSDIYLRALGARRLVARSARQRIAGKRLGACGGRWAGWRRLRRLGHLRSRQL